MRRRGWIVAAALVAAGVAGAGCHGQGGGTDSNGGAAGAPAVVVGTEAAYRPFEFVDAQSHIVGFDIDLMRAIANAGGFTVEFKNQEWDALIPGLENRLDAVISAMTITEKRATVVDFSDGYFDAGQIITVAKGTAGIATPADLQGKTIAVQLNTTGHFQAQKIAGATVKTYDNVELAFQELLAGRADAVINDEPPTRIYIKDKPELQMVGSVFTDEQYGIAVKKGNAALLAKINAGLKQVRASGAYDALKAKWITGTGK